ncbi:transcription termination factor 1-like [Xyrichtys novacula]|nr:transcription termination factor 1-like [Xyrichtys novacula]
MKAHEESPSPQKRKRSHSQQDNPKSVDMETPLKKKKKHRQENEDAILLSSPATDGDMSIKKKKKKKKKEPQQEEDRQDGESDPVMSTETIIKKKKKKKRKQEEEEMHVVEEDQVTEKRKKKNKKKKKQSEEESDFNEVIIATKSTVTKINQHDKDITETKSLSEKGTQMDRQFKMEEDESEVEIMLKEGQTAEKEKTKRRKTDSGGRSYSSLLAELEEYIPNVGKRLEPCIKEMIRYDLPRYRKFKEEGVSVRWGRFSNEENQQLRKNLEDFLALIGINMVPKVLFPHRYKNEEMEIRKLKAQHCFMEKLAVGIPRPSRQIIQRAKRMCDEENHMGQFSEEELKTLIKLQKRHGNNWRAISEKMGRSSFALEKRFACLAEKHGSWSQKEESRLKKALKPHLEALMRQNPTGSGLSRKQLCNNLPWVEISHMVKTRNWIQCRLKWFCLLKTKLGSGAGIFSRKVEGRQAKIQLINTLFNMGVDDIADIDWDEVANTVGKVTPICVQKTYRRLKVSKVPNWNSLSFGEIIDFLHSVVVPTLKKELDETLVREEEEEEEEEEQEQEQEEEGVEEEEEEEQQHQEIYQLSDIFNSEDEFEVDNTVNSRGRKKYR